MKKMISRIIKVMIVIGIAGVVLLFGINGYVKYKVDDSIFKIEDVNIAKAEKADAVLVLGAQVKADGQMSVMLKERVDMGIEVYKQGLTDRIIMSGDHGRANYDEVNTMKDYAIEQGVPSGHIFMDHAGFSTYDSAYRARDIFKVKDLIIVTQKYHLYRALYDAQALGMKAEGIICDKAVYSGDMYRKFREVLARAKDFGYTIIQPEPSYLGEEIPVSGNGDATND